MKNLNFLNYFIKKICKEEKNLDENERYQSAIENFNKCKLLFEDNDLDISFISDIIKEINNEDLLNELNYLKKYFRKTIQI